MRGTFEQARAYCRKDETAIPNTFFEEGKMLKQGRRSDLDNVIDEITASSKGIYELYTTYPAVCARYPRFVEKLYALRNKEVARERYEDFKEYEAKEVYILHGPPGCGKTSYVYEKCGIENIYSMSFGDGTQSSVWFDDYQGEPVLLLDDFYGNIPYDLLLRLLDIYPLKVQSKGGYTYVNFQQIYITSNVVYSQWYHNTKILHRLGALERRITRVLFSRDSEVVADLVLPATSVQREVVDFMELRYLLEERNLDREFPDPDPDNPEESD